MPELTINNIDRISNDIKDQEITFSHLLDDLIDHVCCDVEYEMVKGLAFTEAYQKVKQRMGSRRRLREIQEETLYAVDTKYRYMKKTMKISGIAGTIMFGFASLFKIMHWPGAGILMTLGGVTLAFIFLPSALGVLWKETHSAKKLFLFISAFFAGMFFLMGILFKVQHWPGAGIILSLAALSAILLFIPALLVSNINNPEKKAKRPIYLLGAAGLICYVAGSLFKIQHWPLATLLMMAGLIMLFFIVFPWYTLIYWGKETHIKAEFIYLVVGSLAIVIPSALINLNLQRSYDTRFFLNQEQQKTLYNYMYASSRSNLAKYGNSSFYPDLEKLHSRTIEVIQTVNAIEYKMIAEAEGKPGSPVQNPQQIVRTENGQEINSGLLSRPFQTQPVKDFLLQGTASRAELESAFAAYRNYLSGIIPAGDYRALEKLTDPAICLPSGNPEQTGISLMSALHSLALLKNSLLTAELFAQRKMTNQ